MHQEDKEGGFVMRNLLTWFLPLVLLSCIGGGKTAPFGKLSFSGEKSEIKASRKAMSIPSGQELDAPTKTRFYRYWQDPADPDPGVHSCMRLPQIQHWNEYLTVMSATFETTSTTSHVEVSWTAQLTTFSGEDPYQGIIAVGSVTQEDSAFGNVTQWLPGLNDEFGPFVGRRDESGIGQQTFGGYEGVVLVEPSTTTTVTIEAQSTQGTAYICFFNLTVRY
jgi:hypothetical protein